MVKFSHLADHSFNSTNTLITGCKRNRSIKKRYSHYEFPLRTDSTKTELQHHPLRVEDRIRHESLDTAYRTQSVML